MGQVLIVKNADFSSVAVSTIPSIIEGEVSNQIASAVLKNGYSTRFREVDERNQYIISSNPTRATILVPTDACIKPSPIIYNDLNGQFDNMFIPKGAKKITLNMTNPDYYYGLVLYNNIYVQGYDSGWTQGGTSIILQNNDIPNTDLWLACTLKNGSAGTTAFTDETIASLGWSCEIEY